MEGLIRYRQLHSREKALLNALGVLKGDGNKSPLGRKKAAKVYWGELAAIHAGTQFRKPLTKRSPSILQTLTYSNFLRVVEWYERLK